MHISPKAALRLSLIALVIVVYYLPTFIAQKAGKQAAREKLVQSCMRRILALAGIRLRVEGEIVRNRPLLLVTNHLSYMDVYILGSQAPLTFTPKSEVAHWPVIKQLCTLCEVIYVDRRPEKAAEAKAALQQGLAAGKALCLFPEATTGQGIHLLPFKSSFFSLAEEPVNGQDIQVQPAAISYTRIRRLPIDSTQWPEIAWYGDMDLMPHLWNLLRLGPIEVELTFLPPVTLAEHEDRKKLASYCQEQIAKTLETIRLRQPAAKSAQPLTFKPKFLRG